MSILWIIVLVIAILLVAGMLLVSKARKSQREVKVWMMTAIAMAVVIAIFAGGGALWYGVRLYEHDTCLIRVDSRHDYRISKHADFDAKARDYLREERFYDVVDAATGTTHFTNDALLPGLPSLRESLVQARAELATDAANFDVVTKELFPSQCAPHP